MWNFQLFLIVVWLPACVRRTAAVSHGRIRNVVFQCADPCNICNTEYHNGKVECLGCNLCLKHFSQDSKARATSCLDVDSNNQIVMHSCSANQLTQNWTYVAKTLQLRSFAGCLEASEDSAVAAACDEKKVSQRWTFNASSKQWQSSQAERCMKSIRKDVNGTVEVAISPCVASDDNEKWLIEPMWSMDTFGAGSLLSDEQWEEQRRYYKPPAVDGNHSVLDPDGDGFMNYTAASLVHGTKGTSWGGRQCTPYEILPTRKGERRWESSLEKAALFPASTGVVKKVYYINLDSSVERRKVMESHLNKTGVPYERFAAIEAEDIKNGKYDAELNRTGIAPDRDDEFGTLGCSLSHRHLYKKIFEEDPDGDDIYIVLEDDSSFHDDWKEQLANLLRVIPNDWNAISGAWWHNMRCKDVINEQLALAVHPMWTEVERMPVSNDAYTDQRQAWYAGTGMVILSPRRLRPLLDRLDKSPVADSDMALMSIGATRTYLPVRQLGVARAGGADSVRDQVNAITNNDGGEAHKQHSASAQPVPISAASVSTPKLAPQTSPAWSRMPFVAALAVMAAIGAIGMFCWSRRSGGARDPQRYDDGLLEVGSAVE